MIGQNFYDHVDILGWAENYHEYSPALARNGSCSNFTDHRSINSGSFANLWRLDIFFDQSTKFAMDDKMYRSETWTYH